MAKGKKTGGRVAGAKNAATLEKEKVAAALVASVIAEGMTPLEVMLKAMRKHVEANNWDDAAKQAALAAPYVHPRLAAVEVAGHPDKPINQTLTVYTGVERDADGDEDTTGETDTAACH